MYRVLVGVLFGLTVLLGGLIWYAHPHVWAELGPRGNVTYGLIPSIFSAIFEVGIIVGLIKYFEDQQWRGVRETIKSHISADIRQISQPMLFFVSQLDGKKSLGRRIFKGPLDREYKALHNILDSKELVENLSCLSSGFSADLAHEVGQYINSRNRLKKCLIDLDRAQFWELVVQIDDTKSAIELVKKYEYEQLFAALHTNYHLAQLLRLSPKALGIDSSINDLKFLADFVGGRATLEEAIKMIEADWKSQEELAA